MRFQVSSLDTGSDKAGRSSSGTELFETSSASGRASGHRPSPSTAPMVTAAITPGTEDAAEAAR